jgi:metal-sulfur cluster biosynthetic enzyme
VSRTRATAQRRLARLLRGRKEPHGKNLTDESILRGVEVNDAGIVELWIQPTRAHCPCCLADLITLRSDIKSQRGILACHIEVVGVPQADRWTAAVNE